MIFIRSSFAAILFFSMLICQHTLAFTEIRGAGATFPLPILKQWISGYEGNHSVKVSYLGLGSAEGIKRITARAVDFAITDIGLTRSELSQDDLLQFPLVAGGITPVINLPNVRSGEFKLTGAVLADIYLGKITFWDDARIQSLNPTLLLTHLPISVIHRKDGSGTTFTFTGYLSKVSEDWQNSLGMGSYLRWPVGEGHLGNEGIATKVFELEGAIGYVEYLFAERFKLTTVRLQNKDGVFITPNIDSFRQAFNQASWKRPSYYESLTNLPGSNSWTIVAISYALIHRTSNDREEILKTLDFFDWVFSSGKSIDGSYISISDPTLLRRIKSSWKVLTDSKGIPVLK